MTFKSMSRPTLLAFLVVIFIGWWQGSYYAYNVVMTPDQQQLIVKGIKLAFLGQWEHYGNFVTGGGNVPGSLTTALVGGPLMIWDSPMAPQILVAFLQFVALLLMISVLKDRWSWPQILIFVGLYWLSPWRASKAILWNPSYLFFATALHLWSLDRLNKQPKNFIFSLIHVLAIGFAFELHTSALILALMSFYLFVRKKIHVNWMGTVVAIALVLLSLIPYYQSLQTQSHLAPVVDENKKQFFYGYGLVYVYPLIKGVLYWPRYTSFIFPSYIFKNLDFSFIQVSSLKLLMENSFHAFRFILGGVSMVFCLWGFGWKLKKFWQSKLDPNNFLDHYILAAILSMVIATAASPAELSHWHLFLLYPIAILTFCQFIFAKLAHWRFRKQLFIGAMLYFVFYNFAAVHVAKNYFSTDYNMRNSYQYLKKVMVEGKESQSKPRKLEGEQ